MSTLNLPSNPATRITNTLWELSKLHIRKCSVTYGKEKSVDRKKKPKRERERKREREIERERERKRKRERGRKRERER